MIKLKTIEHTMYGFEEGYLNIYTNEKLEDFNKMELYLNLTKQGIIPGKKGWEY